MSESASKIAFMGIPGAGKSTVCQACQIEIGKPSFITASCTEFAREFLTKHGEIEHIGLQFHITHEQFQREETLAQSCELLLCDSPLYLSYIYGLMSLDPSSGPQRKILKEIYSWAVLNQLDRYECVIYLPKQFEVVNDGVRDPKLSAQIEDLVHGFLKTHKHLFKNYVEIWSEETDPAAILKDRVKKIKDYLKKNEIVP